MGDGSGEKAEMCVQFHWLLPLGIKELRLESAWAKTDKLFVRTGRYWCRKETAKSTIIQEHSAPLHFYTLMLLPLAFFPLNYHYSWPKTSLVFHLKQERWHLHRWKCSCAGLVLALDKVFAACVGFLSIILAIKVKKNTSSHHLYLTLHCTSCNIKKHSSPRN